MNNLCHFFHITWIHAPSSPEPDLLALGKCRPIIFTAMWKVSKFRQKKLNLKMYQTNVSRREIYDKTPN